jgi:hypothetical protein
METRNPIIAALRAFKNVVLEGVPGTGKSYAVEGVVQEWESASGRQLVKFSDGRTFRAVVLHPSSSYEDFVEGLRPQAQRAGGVSPVFDRPAPPAGPFGIVDGFFVDVCRIAAANPDRDVLILLDELNRCNVPSVFGDLLLTLEKSRRAQFKGTSATSTPSGEDWSAPTPVTLPYSGRLFFVPDNVYIIATINTTDRSVAPLDAALRRRFAFHRLEPQMPGTDAMSSEVPSDVRELYVRSSSVLRDLNDHVLRPCLGPDAMLGHSYLYALAANVNASPFAPDVLEELRMQWRYAILPQLVDSVRSLGAEEVLSPYTRAAWFDQHPELADRVNTALPALSQLDGHLQRDLELRIVVDGIGLSRGARIEPFPSDEPLPTVEDDEGSDLGAQ